MPSLGEFIASTQSAALQAILRHWHGARGASRLPSFDQLRLYELSGDINRMWVYRYERKSGSFSGRLAGDQVAKAFGKDFRGMPLEEAHSAKTYLWVHRTLTRVVTEKTRQVPFWTALLFLVHPIHTETVTYVSGRASGLMSFLYLLALLFYIKASEAHAMRGLYRSGAIVAFVLSIGAKETAITFPFVLLLWDLLVHRVRGGASLRAAILRRHLPFWVVLLLTAAWAWSHPRYFILAHVSYTLRPLVDNGLSEAHAAIYALWLFFCPWNQNFDHDLPEFHSMGQWPLPLDLLALGALIAVAVGMACRLPLVSFGIGWFLLQLLPTSLIPRADLFSERNLYLASIGLLLALVVLAVTFARIDEMAKHRLLVRSVGASMACVLVVGLCLMTVQRNSLYRDQLSLWSDAVKKSPNKARPHNNLGHAYALHGEWDRAIDEFRIAAQLDSDYVLAQENLRDAYLHRVGRR